MRFPRAALGLAVLLGGLWATGMLQAAVLPGGTVEELVFEKSGDALTVVQLVSTPRSRFFPVLAGAQGLSVPAGASAVVARAAFAPPSGGHLAEVRYTLPLGQAKGLVLRLRIPVRLTSLWVLTGPGVELPIVLNQAFFAEGTTEQLGVTYQAFAAGGVGPGSVTLRLEVPGQNGWLMWLWLLLAVPVGWWLIVRRRRHAGGP